jgi:hypothetical protein
MPRLNPDLIDTSTPPIPEAYGWAGRYDGRLGPLINMAQAVPSNPPHPELLARFGQDAGTGPAARYGDIGGDRVLREAYAAEVNRVYGSDVMEKEVAVTAGCNLAFFIAVMSVARAGEAVLLPSPWYFNHQMALQMLGIEARVLPVDPAGGFVPEASVAEALIDRKVKAIALVSPNNPTGAVYPPQTFAAFAQLCRRKGLFLVLDETYRDFLPAGHGRPHSLFADPRWRENVIGLYSFSKAYCMPGHRLGAITASRPLLDEIEKALDTVQICPPRPAQVALSWGIGALRDWREENRAELNRRGDAFRAAFKELNDWRLASVGAYFAYVRHPMPGRAAREVAERLAAKRGVLALPGVYFGPGQEDHLRIAFANVGAEVIAQLPQRLRGFSA